MQFLQFKIEVFAEILLLSEIRDVKGLYAKIPWGSHEALYNRQPIRRP